ncbi:MAG: M81 family metallopeptidase [Verrucomicrobia bacterium]|nr:M81 family metallopeptidase [Verrucomicrobiota bacterium]
MRRVLLAGLLHETHTFLASRTEMSDFEQGGAYEGEAILRRWRGDASPAGGFIEVADQLNWQVIPSIYLLAMPSGTVCDAVLERFWRRLESDLQSDFDAVFLILHGAMVCESYPDVEGELLRRVHTALKVRNRTIPIAGVLDPHGNFSDAMAQHSNLLVAYRENPHTDARETACRAARFLAKTLDARQLPSMVHLHLPLLLPPRGTGSGVDPMKAVHAEARKLEAAHPELLAVNVMPGFAYADVPDCGVDFSCATIGAPRDATAWLNDLGRVAWALRECGNLLELPIDEIMPQALRLKEGPVLLVEPSDNIGGGTPGDGTGVLSAFLRHGVRNCGVIINDPDVAAECHQRRTGEVFHVKLGGKTDAFHGATLSLEITLRGVTDGRFTLENPHSHLASITGRNVCMGPTATVECAGVTIVVTSRKTPPMDLGQWRSQGVTPEKLWMIGVKAAVAHKAAYDPIARHSCYVDTPGLGSSDLRRFPYRHVRRPVFPLDDLSWEPSRVQ